MRQTIARFFVDVSGATAIEYGLIGALISLAIIAGAGSIGSAVNNLFTSSSTKVGTVSDKLN